MRFNPYDNVMHRSLAASSVALLSLTGSTEVDTAGIDTAQDFIAESIMLHIRNEIASGSPTTSTFAWALQESNDNGVSDAWANAVDNTGTAIGGTINAKTIASDTNARVEGINLYAGTAAPHGGRKRWLRVALTPAFSGGTSPAILVYSEFLGTPGSGANRPVRTAVSNT